MPGRGGEEGTAPMNPEESVFMPKVTFLFPPPGGGWAEAVLQMPLGF